MKRRIISAVMVAAFMLALIPQFTLAATVNEYNTDKEVPVLTIEGGTDKYGEFEFEDMWIKGWYQVYDDEPEDASGGKYIRPLSDGTTTTDAQVVRDQVDGEDHVKLYIDIKEGDYYTFWIRSKYQGNDGNYWVNLDGTTTMYHFSNAEHFTWNSAFTRYLEPGKHYLGFVPRRVNIMPDKFIITNSEYYAPVGKGTKPAPFKLGKEGETLTDLYFPLPAFTPPEKHPRLYITPESIPGIKKNLTHPQNIKAWEFIKALADKKMNCKLSSGGAYSYSQDVHDYVEACAFVYALDPVANKSYGEKAVNGLRDYVSTLSYSGDSLTMARSGIIQYIAKVYDWCHDLLTDEDKELFIKKGLAISTKLECGWPPVKLSAFNSDHGSEGAIQVDFMSFAIATYEDYPDIWNAAAGRFFAEYVAINNFYYDQDQWQAEGDSYGHSRFSYEAKGNTILNNVGWGGLVSENEKYLPLSLIYRRRPDGNFLGDGDIWEYAFKYNGEVSSPLFVGNRYKIPWYKYEVYKFVADGITTEGGDMRGSRIDYLINNDVNLGLASHEDLPLTWYSGEGHNMMTARTGWDEGMEANTMVVSMKGGGRTRGGHVHLDGGNFFIYYKGPLALDSGVYNGQTFVDAKGNVVTNVAAGSYHFANYQQRTIAHNCVLVYDPNENMRHSNLGELNDGGQIRSRAVDDLPSAGMGNKVSYETATDDMHIFAKRLGVDMGPDIHTPSYSYLKTDLTNAYRRKMKEYQRTFTFLNFFDETYPGALIVLDRVESSDPDFKKSWLIHSQEEPVTDVEAGTIKIDRTEYGYNGRLITETLLPKAEDRVYEKVGGEGQEYTVGGTQVMAVTITKGDESGKWRVELSPKSPKTLDWFLNVMHVYDADDSIPSLKSELYESGNHAGVKIRDRVVYLSKVPERTSKPVTVYADGGEETLEYMVDGLKTGKWEVLDTNNKRITTCDVTDEGGVAFFKAPAGAYTLSKMRGFANIPSKNFDVFENAKKGANPIKPKLKYNNLFVYFEKELPVVDGELYIPMEKLMKTMDSDSVLTDNGSGIKLVFEDNTFEFTEGSPEVKITYASDGSTKLKNVSKPLKRFDGAVHVSISTVKELFEKETYYEDVGKIGSITNSFARPKDYILNSPKPERIAVKDTYSNGVINGRAPYLALDGDVSTNWGTQTNGEYAVFEFKEVSPLKKVRIKWNDPTHRSYNYQFYTSVDGENYTLAKEGNTGYTAGGVDYELNVPEAKYFKVVSQGNTLNNWFVILEIEFYNK